MVIGLWIGSSPLLPMLIWLQIRMLPWSLLSGVVVVLGPALLLQRMAESARTVFEKAAIECIAGLRDNLGSGISIEHACIELGRNGPEPLRRDWQRLERDLSVGIPFNQALRRLAMHLADPTMDLVVAALIFNEVRGGGQIRTVLARLGHAATARRVIEEERRANQAKTVTQARVLIAAAPIMLAIMTLLDRNYLLAFASPVGQTLLVLALVLIGVAYWLMMRLGDSQSPERILLAHMSPSEETASGSAAAALAASIAIMPARLPLDAVVIIAVIGFGLAIFALLRSMSLGRARLSLAEQVRRLDPQQLPAHERGEGAYADNSADLLKLTVAAIDRRASKLLALFEMGRGEERAQQLALVWPGVTTGRFAGRRVLCALGFFAIPPLLNVSQLAPGGGWPLWVCLPVAAVGFAWPHRRLGRALVARRDSIIQELPLIVDLLMLAVSAGDNLEGALRQVGREVGGTLGEELRRLTRALDGGNSSLGGALGALATRNEVRELTGLVEHLRASDRVGHGLLESLTDFGDGLRAAEHNRLIADAGRAQVKMLLPMAGLLFPVILILVFYPAVLQLFDAVAVR